MPIKTDIYIYVYIDERMMSLCGNCGFRECGFDNFMNFIARIYEVSYYTKSNGKEKLIQHKFTHPNAHFWQ